MVRSLELIEIGDDLGVILPEDVTAKLQVGLGDEIYLTETANWLTLTKFDPEFEAQLNIGRELMKERHDVLQALAK
jgi:putative addiction module antidote